MAIKRTKFLTLNIDSSTITTNYTILPSDSGRKIDVNSSSIIDVTIPLDTNPITMPKGTQIIFKQWNIGKIHFVINNDGEIHSAGNKYYSKQENSVCQLIYEGTNIWTLFGDLSIN